MHGETLNPRWQKLNFLFVFVSVFCLFSAQLTALAGAQSQRSAWMWNASGHPYGAANVIGSSSKEEELISNFGAWGFDRIYVSAGTKPITDSSAIASWNAQLDSVGVDSQFLFGIILPNPSNLAGQVQSRVINFNNLRSDPSERFDGVHLDIEPHGSSAWSNGTPADRRDLLLDLRDTYAAVRSQLDNNGAPEVKIYADMPVWYDSSSKIGWLDSADREQWFDDVATSLDGITMMAFERNTLSKINSGVSWEVANFAGDVRIGLNANEVGPGDTFEDYAEMFAMAESLEFFHGSAISGIDFQPLVTYTDLAPAPFFFTADFDQDGVVDGADFLSLQRGYGITSGASIGQGDANGSGSVNQFDIVVWKDQYGSSSLVGIATVPEPTSWSLASFILAGIILRRRLLACSEVNNA